MDVCKCIVTSRHGGTPNRRRAASPFVRLVEGEERWETSDHPQSVLPLNWGGTEPNHAISCMGLKATGNDKRHLALCHDEFRGPRFGLCRSSDISNNNISVLNTVAQRCREKSCTSSFDVSQKVENPQQRGSHDE
ncbi:uncharacterized protein TNCV_4542061 [Trichonephila clavipes]|nr:uncharacterized protein TNCV_4542061 [Trichonephila clavipes]